MSSCHLSCILHLHCHWKIILNFSDLHQHYFENMRCYVNNLITSIACTYSSESEMFEYFRYLTSINIPSIPSANFSHILTTVYIPVCVVYTIWSTYNITCIRQSLSQQKCIYSWGSLTLWCSLLCQNTQ